MFRATPHDLAPYDHERRLRDGAHHDVSRGIKKSQYLQATGNKLRLTRIPDRLKLMKDEK